MIRFTRSLALTLLATAGSSGVAFAHAHLKAATPAIGGIVAAAPATLDLAFTEALNLKFTGVTVSGPGNAAVTTGPAALASGDDTQLVVPLAGTLAAGTYTVAWHALAKDGHKTSGTYTFTVKP